MPFQADKEISLTDFPSSKYIISSQHRKTGNPNKSIWIISFNDEVECFLQTLEKNWKQHNEGWGIKVLNDALQVIGNSVSKDELKIAKFVDGSNTDVWHGYPADYMRNSQDRPTTEILTVWVNSGYITKSKMSKIRKGFSCNL